jgi:hypothetical protein
MAALGPHDRPTLRAAAKVAGEVSESQILEIVEAPSPQLGASARRRHLPTLDDPVTQTFFAEGDRQEATGLFKETEHIRLRSLDRVPRRWWPMMVTLCLLMAATGAGMWWMGLRPPGRMQRARAWQLLHLSPMPPPPHAG